MKNILMNKAFIDKLTKHKAYAITALFLEIIVFQRTFVSFSVARHKSLQYCTSASSLRQITTLKQIFPFHSLETSYSKIIKRKIYFRHIMIATVLF